MSGMSAVPSNMLASNLESNMAFSQLREVPPRNKDFNAKEVGEDDNADEDDSLEKRLAKIRQDLNFNYEGLDMVEQKVFTERI